MNKIFKEKLKESALSLLPIIFIILLFSILFNNENIINMIPSFLIGSICLVIGVTLFDIGSEMSMIDLGFKIGKHLTKKGKLFFILLITFIIGFIVTVAEPDLSVLSKQVPNITPVVFIGVISIGVGASLLLAVLRIILKWNYNLLVFIILSLAFILTIFVPSEMIPLGFDTGGVTTGPISVPFMIALCAGISYKRHDKNRKEDVFGMISFSSLGPIVIFLLLGLIYKTKTTYDIITIDRYDSIFAVVRTYINDIPIFAKEVLITLSPILLLLIIYNFKYLKLKKKELIKILIGILYLFIGLTLFALGVNVGYLPTGYIFGKEFANNTFIIVLIGAFLGYFIIKSEPALKVLVNQIEDISSGYINKKLLRISISIGVAIAVSLSVIRLVYEISIIYFLLPLYLIALILTFFVPQIFTRVAFDSGGVASGSLTASFILPFAIGIAETLKINVLNYAFGLIAMVATVPLIMIQLIGLLYKYKMNQAKKKQELETIEIVDF